MVVTHNIEAGFASRQIGITNRKLGKNTEKLTSGYRVNRAADDASGLAISEKLRGQVRGLSRSALNTDDGTSFCQIADGAMQEVENIIHRMRELSVQAADDLNTPQDRQMIQFEIEQLETEIDRITDNTEYNTMKIFTEPDRSLNIQAGGSENQFITIDQPYLNAAVLGVSALDLTTRETAGQAISAADSALDILNTERAYIGGMVIRLSHAYDNVKVAEENTQSSESLIRDLDMADEMMKNSANNIVLQAAQSMLSQANSSKDGVLALVRE